MDNELKIKNEKIMKNQLIERIKRTSEKNLTTKLTLYL